MLGGISPIQLIIILAIVILIFGTKKIRNMGKDIGGAVKGFKEGMGDGEDKSSTSEDDAQNLLHKREQSDDADFETKDSEQKDTTERKD